jgi:hypothetical protein
MPEPHRQIRGRYRQSESGKPPTAFKEDYNYDIDNMADCIDRKL